MSSTELRKITIIRTMNKDRSNPAPMWEVIRERATNGEKALCADLEEAFDYIRCLYDRDGRMRQLDIFGTEEGK